jgi:RimJ/RimL family protein N-acetyltransferase
MQQDDLSVAYADAFPRTLTDFRLEVEHGDKMLLLCLVDDNVAGVWWLHDMIRSPDDTAVAGWVGGYFLPAYRGRLAAQLWRPARQHWEATGVHHFFCATHVANRRSQAYVARGMEFRRVGIFSHFTTFNGQPTDVVIYTLHAEDADLAWKLATARAGHQISSVV